MRASDRDKNVLFRLIKNQRSTSSLFTQVLRVNDKEVATPEDINVVFKYQYWLNKVTTHLLTKTMIS
jgi:hypothetical protein